MQNFTDQSTRYAIGAIFLAAAVILVLASAPVSAQSDSAPVESRFCLAQNLYHEARSEGREGMIAVGWVVLNRVESSLYPDSVCGVIYDGGERPPCEFNWWCDGRSDKPTEPGVWRLAAILADQLLSDPPSDPTNGALWFHNDSIEAPGWLRAREQTLYLGSHYFYR